MRIRRLLSGLAIGGGVVGLLVPTAYFGFMAGAVVLAWSRHLAVVLFVVVAGLGWMRTGRRAAIVGVAGLLAAVLPWVVLPSTVAVQGESEAICGRVVSINAYERNEASAADIRASLLASNADVVLLIEPRPGLVDELEGSFVVATQYIVGGKFDLAILVRPSASEAVGKIHHFDDSPSVVASVDWPCGAGVVRVHAVHIPAPTTPAQQRARWTMKDQLARVITSSTSPAIVAGDFNSVPPDPVMRTLGSAAGLVRLDDGATWPVWFGPFGLPIDHVLTTSPAIVGSLERFVLPGSDHVGFVFDVMLGSEP